MTNLNEITARMKSTGWFETDGCYTLFDGQYGSTGKGLLASVIAETMGDMIDTVTTNAGPNSGHTGYYKGEKILTQQIPVASIVMDRMMIGHDCYLNAGAIIEPAILERELDMYQRREQVRGNVYIHPAAAVIKPKHQGDQLSHIASTGKGVGPAMASKLGRTKDAVIGEGLVRGDVNVYKRALGNEELGRCFVETAQGWSLGINSGFYPYTTSRECSVAQALADLGVSPVDHRKSIVSLRTYPIRVGNTPDGFSGPVYPDQEEITFESLGVEPERTTVTQRIRRIFTWSDLQFEDMLRANKPDAIFINFLNYLGDNEGDWREFVGHLNELHKETLGHDPDFVLMGFGPYNSDVRVWDGIPF